MTTSIEQILATPNKTKEIEYNIISAISNDMNSWYLALKNTIVWWGNKSHKKDTKKILSWHQIMTAWEQREQSRSEKRAA